MKDVFGSERASGLLRLLAEAKHGVRYSEARRDLGLRPQEFQRALDTLESYALVELRTASESSPRNAVFLEATILGKILAEARMKMEKDVATLARRHGVSRQALETLAAES